MYTIDNAITASQAIRVYTRLAWLANPNPNPEWMMNEINEWMNENAMILSAFENRLRAGLVQHTIQTNPAVEQNKNVKWAESP